MLVASMLVASLGCKEGELRLMKDGGTIEGHTALLHEGRVEMCHEGQWGTFCDVGWGIEEAAVVCSMLGFPGVKAAYVHAANGPGQGPIWMKNLNCPWE